MEAATAADLTQASEIPGRYITLGIPAKGYVSGLTVGELITQARDPKQAICYMIFVGFLSYRKFIKNDERLNVVTVIRRTIVE